MLSLLFKNKALQNLKFRSSYCTYTAKPWWFNKTCTEFNENMELSNPKSSETLMKIFLDANSYQLLSEDPDKAARYLTTIIGEAKVEKDKIKSICNFLTREFDPKFLTSNDIQLRFGEDKFRFFWNSYILKAYNDAVESSNKKHLLAGPKNIGKSFNFALFRNILSSNVTENRVIYLHNPDDLFVTNNPFQWILDELQFTFAHDLRTGDKQVFQALDKCYGCLEATYKVQQRNLSNLLSLNLRRGKKQYLLVDQQNVLSRYGFIMSQGQSAPLVLETYNIATFLIDHALPRSCKRVIRVASMTDEGSSKQGQEVNTVELYKVLPEEMAKIFVKSSSQDIAPGSDDINSVLDTSGRIPGEIAKILKSKGDKVSQKLQNYVAERVVEIQRDIQNFLSKKKEQNKSEEATNAMNVISACIDTGYRPKTTPLPSDYDRRYIYVEGERAKSLFPLVKKALRSLFPARDQQLTFLNEMFEGNEMDVVGTLFENFMVQAFLDADKTNPVHMTLKGGLKNKDNLRSFIFNTTLNKKPIKKIDEINLNGFSQDTIFVPEAKTFKDIDLIIYLKNEKVLLIIQFKYKDDLYSGWRDFFKKKKAVDSEVPLTSNTSAEESKTEQPLQSNKEATDSKVPQASNTSTEESEIGQLMLSCKDVLTEKFQTQIEDIKVKFIFGFLVYATSPDTLGIRIAKSLGDDVYYWDTTEIPDLRQLDLKTSKKSANTDQV